MPERMSVKNHVDSFCGLLDSIDANKITQTEYTRKYLQHLLLNKKYFVGIYAYVLDTLLEHSRIPAADLSLLDCGAGNGLLGIFAKYCGFKRVYINDTDPDFIASAETLSRELSIPCDGFIAGDILHAKRQLALIQIDAIVGTDVIEHIYSIDKLFSILQEMNPDMLSVFTTASNPYNYLRTKEIIRIQVKDEHEGGAPGDGLLSGPTVLPAFIKIREDIIRLEYPSLTNEEIKRLAALTRGMAREDILSVAKKYYSENILPAPPIHPTNTCNPNGGSWSERLLTIQEYSALYKKHGFSLSMQNGFYNENRKSIKGIIIYSLNRVIRYFPYLGKYVAPFIVLTGSRDDLS